MPPRKKVGAATRRVTRQTAAEGDDSVNTKKPARKTRRKAPVSAETVEEGETEEEEDPTASALISIQQQGTELPQASESSSDNDSEAELQRTLVTSPVKPLSATGRRVPSRRLKQPEKEAEQHSGSMSGGEESDSSMRREVIKLKKQGSAKKRRGPPGRPTPSTRAEPTPAPLFRPEPIPTEALQGPWDPSSLKYNQGRSSSPAMRGNDPDEDDDDPDRPGNPKRPKIFLHSVNGRWYRDRIWLYDNFATVDGQSERDMLEASIVENGGKIVDDFENAQYAIFPRGDANLFREMITEVKKAGALPVYQLWIAECLQASSKKADRGIRWRCKPELYVLKPTAIRAPRKEFTFEEKMYLARQMIKVDRELFKTPLIAAERAERKFRPSHPLASWHNLMKKSEDLELMKKSILRRRSHRGKKSCETTDDEDEEAEDELDSEVEEDDERSKPRDSKKHRKRSLSTDSEDEDATGPEAESVAEEEEELPSVKHLTSSKKRAADREKDEEAAEAPTSKKARLVSKLLPKSPKTSSSAPSALRRKSPAEVAKEPTESSASARIKPALLQPLADQFPELSHRRLKGLFYYSSGDLATTERACTNFDEPWLWKPSEDSKIRSRGREGKHVDLEGRDSNEVMARYKFLKLMDKAAGLKENQREPWHPEHDV